MNVFKKNNFNTILILILIVMNLASLYFLFSHQNQPSRPFPKHDKKHQERSVNFLKKELNLTKSQTKEFNKLKKEHREQSKEIRVEMHKLHKELFDNIGNENFNVEKNINNIAQTQKQMELGIYNHFTALREICNEKQKKKFDRIIHKVLRTMMPSQNEKPSKKVPF